jgi:hypothetical protein
MGIAVAYLARRQVAMLQGQAQCPCLPIDIRLGQVRGIAGHSAAGPCGIDSGTPGFCIAPGFQNYRSRTF